MRLHLPTTKFGGMWKISVHGIDYREKIQFGGVQVSFHSAGHILGSAQIRIEWSLHHLEKLDAAGRLFVAI